MATTSHSSDLHKSTQNPKLLLLPVSSGSAAPAPVCDLLEALWVQEGSLAPFPASLTFSSQVWEQQWMCRRQELIRVSLAF